METSWYQATKLFLVSALGLSRDALHIYVGLGVYFVVAILPRRPLSSFVPLAAALLPALAGEALDLRDDVRSLGYWRWQASLGDVLNTTFWPFVIWLLARVRMLPVRETSADSG
jgi:hypothetical protein